MAKVILPLILAAFVVTFIVVAVKYGTSCPPNAYCPSGGGSVSTDNGHYNPPDPDPQHENWHPEFPG